MKAEVLSLKFNNNMKNTVRIIHNKVENHFEELKWLFGESIQIIIVSPFISIEAILKLAKILPEKVKDVTLVTTLKPFDTDQFNKVKALVELNKLKKLRGFNLSIRIDNDLHGKVYIGRKEDIYVGCIITSANFTQKGLEQNHEWGVFIDDQDKIRQIKEQVLEDAFIVVDDVDLLSMVEYMDKHPEENVKRLTIEANFVGMLKPILASKGKTVTYWLKPLGTIEEPVPETLLFDKKEMDITFARFPRSVMAGDILIAYSVKTQRMLSVFTALEERGPVRFFRRDRDRQWPWYAKCKNDTLKFGQNWPNIDMTLRDLRESYFREYPNGLISIKSQRLDALKRGHDHIRLNANFAEYVIRKMTERM